MNIKGRKRAPKKDFHEGDLHGYYFKNQRRVERGKMAG